MIKLISLLELNINKLTPEVVFNYFNTPVNINDFKELCKPYCIKYDIPYFINTIDDLKKLSQSDLHRFYNEFKQLVNEKT